MEHVTRVIPRDDFHLELEFDTGEEKLFDARPYLERGVFRRLRDPALFKQAYVSGGTVCWPDDLDIAPETLYDRSVSKGSEPSSARTGLGESSREVRPPPSDSQVTPDPLTPTGGRRARA